MGLSVGEFEPFLDGAEVATISGSDVDLICGRLGSRPPFRTPGEMDSVSFDDAMLAKRIAIRASCVMDLAFKVGETSREANRIIVSKSGAIAVRCYDSEVLKQTKQAIKELDGNNDSLMLATYPARIG